MIDVFRPKITKKLIEILDAEISIRTALEEINLLIKNVLKNYSLEIPAEFLPHVGWTVFGSNTGSNVDLIEKILKTAWLYSVQGYDSEFHSLVCNELSLFKHAMEHLKRRKQNQNNAKNPRPRIPAADEFIKKSLKVNIDAKPEEIWKSLPESQDIEDLEDNEEDEELEDKEDLYRDGDFLYSILLPAKKLSLRAFEIRVKKNSGTINT